MFMESERMCPGYVKVPTRLTTVGKRWSDIVRSLSEIDWRCDHSGVNDYACDRWSWGTCLEAVRTLNGDSVVLRRRVQGPLRPIS